MEITKTSHIAVLAFPFSSHPAAILNVAQRLAASASPGAIFSFFCTPATNAKIFPTTTQISCIKPYNVWDGIAPEDEHSPKSPLQLAELFLKATPHNFSTIVAKAEAETGVKVSCILADTFLWFAGEMAEKMCVPWMAFWIGGASSLSAHVHTDLIRANFSDKCEDTTLNIIPGLSDIRVVDLPDGVITGDLESPFSKMLQNIGPKLAGATAVAINSFEELEPDATSGLRSVLRNVLNIGPSTITIVPPMMSNSDDESGCLAWLDNHEKMSVVYIGFGTMQVPPPDEISALAEALLSSKLPFIWSLKDAMRSLLPDEFSEKTCGHGKIVAWAPQLQILSHPSLGAYITHCGFSSLMESILSGVAVVARPLFGETVMNSRLVEQVWKIGVRVEGGKFTKFGTIKSLESVLFGEKGREMRDNVEVLRKMLLQSTGPDGTSTQNFKTFLELATCHTLHSAN